MPVYMYLTCNACICHNYVNKQHLVLPRALKSARANLQEIWVGNMPVRLALALPYPQDRHAWLRTCSAWHALAIGITSAV